MLAHHSHASVHHTIMLHLALLGDDRYGDSGHAKGGNGSEGEFYRTFHSVSPASQIAMDPIWERGVPQVCQGDACFVSNCRKPRS
jgi:hypothetical protein